MTDIELITEFMGLHFDRKVEEYPVYMWKDANCAIHHEWPNSDGQYHKSWDWLIPVIEKIDSLKINNCICCQTNHTSHTFYIHYNFGSAFISDDYPTYSEGRHRAEGETRIHNVYLAVIEFIKWYNQNK